MLKLVEFSCGCIGTPPEDGKTIKIYDCRYDGDGLKYSFCGEESDTEGKKFGPLEPWQENEIIRELGQVARDAQRFRQIKDALS